MLDHFGDCDTLAAAAQFQAVPHWGHNPPSVQYDRLLEQLQQCVQSVSPVHRKGAYPWCGGVFLGGGMENWPELLEAIATHFLILGPSAAQITQLRSLEFLLRSAAAAGVRVPPTLAQNTPAASSMNSNSQWIWKPFQGAGGLKINRLSTDLLQSVTSSPLTADRASPGYWQQFQRGRVVGATCILDDDSVEFVGATESYLKEDWAGPSEFIYRGSWGPLPLSPQLRRRIVALAECVRQEIGLRGWLQMDLVVDDAQRPWLLEYNPRWTAGMEVLVATGRNPVAAHCRAYRVHLAPSRKRTKSKPCDGVLPVEHQFAKAVYYAEQDIELTPPRLDALHRLGWHQVGDLPTRDSLTTVIPQGHPLLTLKASCRHSASPASLSSDDAEFSQSVVRRVLLDRLDAVRTRVEQAID